jgi:hypothetical protein
VTSNDPGPEQGGRRTPPALKDILAGVVFVAFGGGFALIASTYQVGTTVRMGPGYFPLALGIVLALLGGLIVVKAFLDGEPGTIGEVPWRGIGLILGAVVFFGITVRGLGLVPAIFFTATLAAFASVRIRPVAGLIISASLTVLCVLIFVVALRLRLPLVGPWIPI